MRPRHALPIGLAALLGALAIFALPALAGAKGEDHHHGHDRMEHRHHHHGDRGRHENVGRISAFDAGSGELTIARFGGGTISGTVTGSTEIKCEEEPGDDHGGRNDDQAQACTTADLTVGAVVHEADREFSNGVATFDEIELAH